ncbi:MAG: hypothetical protein JSV23_00790 [Promethearchaeota archaeon]|nr:MAG: hypothetical protein JSV23_00790 [Candidatus Lokiarchaeota archaeon]
MEDITQKKDIYYQNRDIRASNLVRESKVLTLARLAKMLVDLFGSDEPFKKIGKWAGQEIELYFKDIDSYITFILTSERENFDCYAKKAINPISKVTITVKEDKILQFFSDIVRTKNNFFGIIKLLKFIIPKKAIIKGSYIAAIKWVRTIMIGKHSIYKDNK